MSSGISQMQGFDLGVIAQPAAAVEKYLALFLDQRHLPGNLGEAVRYALLGGGKRLRPILVMRACEAVGGQAQDAVVPAAAIEMIHCFSLVHDDLPAMDDDDLRRGRPTLHRYTNEAMAILAGDVLMGLAFELIATQLEAGELAGRLVQELAIATNDMIAGQVLDTLGDGKATAESIEQLQRIHRYKTGALIRCCGRMGALCGGADQEQLEAMTRFSETIGLMFQVVDDLLDVTQTTEHLGKAANKDISKGKLTYPGLLGIPNSKSEIDRLQEEAHQALEPLGERARMLHDLCDYMVTRQK